MLALSFCSHLCVITWTKVLDLSLDLCKKTVRFLGVTRLYSQSGSCSWFLNFRDNTLLGVTRNHSFVITRGTNCDRYLDLCNNSIFRGSNWSSNLYFYLFCIFRMRFSSHLFAIVGEVLITSVIICFWPFTRNYDKKVPIDLWIFAITCISEPFVCNRKRNTPINPRVSSIIYFLK